MEGWVEWKDAVSGRYFRHPWQAVQRLDEGKDEGTTNVIFDTVQGISIVVKMDYADAVINMNNAVEREREYFKKQGVLVCDDSIST